MRAPNTTSLASPISLTPQHSVHGGSPSDYLAPSPQPSEESLIKANRTLEWIRKELIVDDVPGLNPEEQDAILKTERGTQKVRVSVVPENIVFEESLASLTWKFRSRTSVKGSQAKLSERQADGYEAAALLLAEARRLGVPGAPEDLRPPAGASSSGKTRRSRSP